MGRPLTSFVPFNFLHYVMLTFKFVALWIHCINSINYRHSTHKNENTIEEEDEKEKIKDEPISIPLPTDPLELLKMIDSQNQPEFDEPKSSNSETSKGLSWTYNLNFILRKKTMRQQEKNGEIKEGSLKREKSKGSKENFGSSEEITNIKRSKSLIRPPYLPQPDGMEAEANFEEFVVEEFEVLPDTPKTTEKNNEIKNTNKNEEEKEKKKEEEEEEDEDEDEDEESEGEDESDENEQSEQNEQNNFLNDSANFEEMEMLVGDVNNVKEVEMLIGIADQKLNQSMISILSSH